MNEIEKSYEKMEEIYGAFDENRTPNEVVNFINEYASIQRNLLSTKEGRDFLIEKKIDIYMGLFTFMMTDEDLSDIESNSINVIDKENLDLARKESAEFFDEMINEYMKNIDMDSATAIGKVIKKLEKTFGLSIGEYRKQYAVSVSTRTW